MVTMNNEQVIQLLQKRRHDDLNELQLIHAYIGMNKYEQLQLKMKSIIESISLEQQLFNLNIPQFTLFIVQFNYKHSHARLVYNIHIKKMNLLHVDNMLHSIGQHISTYVNNQTEETTLYEINVTFKEKCARHILIVFEINNLTEDEQAELKILINEIGQKNLLHYFQTDVGMKIELTIPKQ